MNEAKERGVNMFLSSVWSPPAWMKQNGSVIDNRQGPNKIRRDAYQQYADYLASYVEGYKEHFDINITHISPTNEPDLSGGYSSSLWTPDELNEFVRDYMGPTFEDRDIPADILLGEGMEFSERFALAALNDPVTNKYVDVVGAHAYIGLQNGSTSPRPNAFAKSNELGKSIWQTEYMNQGSRMQTYENNTITDGLRYANLIGNMFDETGLNAYLWWWPAANNGADGSDLIRLMHDGSDQGIAPTETGLYRVFKRFYTFGNYSRFIQPGYVMIEADKHPEEEAMVTAYKDPETGNFTIVAVNNSTESQTITFDLEGFPQTVGAVVPYRTSASENLKKLDAINVADQKFTMELRGSSVTSFIPEEFELPALPDMKDVFSSYLATENDGQSVDLQVDEDINGEKVITNVGNNSYIQYSNVNFADGSANGEPDKLGILSMNARVASYNGGEIEVRLGNAQGKIVGTMDVPKNEDWDEWFTVSTMIDTDSVDGAQGFHDIFLVFKGDIDEDMFNVSYFDFSDGNLAPPIDEPGPGEVEEPEQRRSEAIYGTPEIDAEMDAIWENANQISTDRIIEGTEDEASTAIVRTLWDEEYLYIYADIADELLSKKSGQAHEQDSIEIFLDQNNEKTTNYQPDDGQFRVNFDNEQSYNGMASADNFTTATRITEAGYVVEAAIKLDIAPSDGTVIGFDVQVNNDATGEGRRDTVAIWNDITGESYQNTSSFGELELVTVDPLESMVEELMEIVEELNERIKELENNSEVKDLKDSIQEIENEIYSLREQYDELSIQNSELEKSITKLYLEIEKLNEISDDENPKSEDDDENPKSEDDDENPKSEDDDENPKGNRNEETPPVIESDQDGDSTKSPKEDNKLPSTATSMYTIIFFGLAVLTLGGFIMLIQKRLKKTKNV